MEIHYKKEPHEDDAEIWHVMYGDTYIGYINLDTAKFHVDEGTVLNWIELQQLATFINENKKQWLK